MEAVFGEASLFSVGMVIGQFAVIILLCVFLAASVLPVPGSFIQHFLRM